MHPGCYMASIDLKDAYYSIPIHKDHQKYLKFAWWGKLYQYTCFPNGLAICPRKFTKMLKPVVSTLRGLGHKSTIYIDDSYLQGADFDQCSTNLIDTMNYLTESDSLPIQTNHPCILPKNLCFRGLYWTP